MVALIAALLANVLLLVVILVGQPSLRIAQHGMDYALSNFDVRQEENKLEKRLAMVRNNQLEAMALWVPVVVAALWVFPHDYTSTALTYAAWGHVIARVLYSLVSVAGVPYARSAIWGVSFVAWAVVLWQVAAQLLG